MEPGASLRSALLGAARVLATLVAALLVFAVGAVPMQAEELALGLAGLVLVAGGLWWGGLRGASAQTGGMAVLGLAVAVIVLAAGLGGPAVPHVLLLVWGRWLALVLPVPRPAARHGHRDAGWLGLALALVVCAWIESGVLGHALGAWWGLLWPWPAALVSLRGVAAPRSRSAVVPPLRALPLATLPVAWLLEATVGRTAAVPWWATHALVALVTLGAVRALPASRRAAPAALALAAFAVPWIAVTPRQELWQAGVRLRLGADVASVARVGRGLLDGDGERIGARPPESWTTFAEAPRAHLGLGHAWSSADWVLVELRHGRVASVELSPD